jgi:hypothetical protein
METNSASSHDPSDGKISLALQIRSAGLFHFSLLTPDSIKLDFNCYVSTDAAGTGSESGWGR